MVSPQIGSTAVEGVVLGRRHRTELSPDPGPALGMWVVLRNVADKTDASSRAQQTLCARKRLSLCGRRGEDGGGVGEKRCCIFCNGELALEYSVGRAD